MSWDRRPSGDHVSRKELQDALRFIHDMEMQNKEQIDRIDDMLAALIRALLDDGVVDRMQVESMLPAASAQSSERTEGALAVDVAPTEDKYAVESPADLDCAALLPICKARCCRLSFPLSFQDLDEGEIQWDYAIPYRIRQGEDGYCVHNDPETRCCSIYERRPATCRTYDCRDDPRIWADFENRIPAPMDAVKSPQRLYSIRRTVRDGASRMDEPPGGADDDAGGTG